MSTDRARRLFASYSRKDARRVHGLVRLIRASGAPVFLDVDSIPAGTKWRAEIEQAIDTADAVVVFWSPEAATSAEVAREIEVALRLGKDIIPALLDDIPLPPTLTDYQGVLLADLWSPHDVTFDARPHVDALLERMLRPQVNSLTEEDGLRLDRND